jgi:predicted nucleotidyltransferase
VQYKRVKRCSSTNSRSILASLGYHAAELKRYGIVEIGLFGSWVNGKPRRSSDVDILVEFAPGTKTFDNYMDAKFFLEGIFRRKVDLVLKSSLKPALRQRILESTRYVTIV